MPATPADAMTYEETVRWLRRYQESLRQEQELAKEVEQLQSEACRMTPLLSGMPSGGSDGQGLPRAVERILAAKQDLQAQIERGCTIRREITDATRQIPHPRDQEILRRRYLLGQRWEEIAVEMHIELRWVYRRHRQAVTFLTMESHCQKGYNGSVDS